jgi:hypothetical protein
MLQSHPHTMGSSTEAVLTVESWRRGQAGQRPREAGELGDANALSTGAGCFLALVEDEDTGREAVMGEEVGVDGEAGAVVFFCCDDCDATISSYAASNVSEYMVMVMVMDGEGLGSWLMGSWVGIGNCPVTSMHRVVTRVSFI